MIIAFWIVLLLEFYWLMVETNWLRVRILYGRPFTDQLIGVVVGGLIAYIVASLLTESIITSTKPIQPWQKKGYKVK